MTTAASYSSLVQELYIAYFGRPADYFGLQNFETALAAANAPIDPAALAAAYSTNAAVKTLIDSFGTSAESTALYGSGSTESFVNAIFENLFGRAAAVSGLTFWTNAINTGEVSKGDAALAILAGAEPTSNSSSQATTDWDLVKAKVAVATNFTTDLGASSPQIVAYAGSAAAQDARLMLSAVTATTDAATFDVQTTINNIVAGNSQNTYTLTTGVDTIQGGTGNNTFNAVLDNAAGVAAGGQAVTLQAFDTITGGTLNNTLNITDFSLGGQTSIPTGATVTGITALNINTLQGVSEDFSSWSGLTSLNVKSADGDISVTVPDATVVNVNDTAGTVSISGGSTVTAKTDTAHEIIVNGSADTSSVSLTGGVYDSITDHNFGTSTANTITTVSLTAVGLSGAYSYTTIESSALTTLNITDEAAGVFVESAAGTRTLTINLDGDGPGYTSTTGGWVEDGAATTLVVNAINKASDFYIQADSATSFSFNDSVNLTLSDFYATDAKTITISGAGDFNADLSTNVSGTAAVDATGASGVVTLTLAAGQSFAGGSGQDIISIGASQTGTVAGGSAHNEIILNNAGSATVADIASVTNFSIFGIEGNTQGVFDMSKVSGYDAYDVQSAGGNVTFANVANNSTLSIEASDIAGYTVTMQTADANAATDSFTLNLGSASAVPFGITVGQITLEDSTFAGTGNVTINNVVGSSEVHNSINELSDDNIVSLNLTGSGELTILNLQPVSTSLTINNNIAGHSSTTVGIQDLGDNFLSTLTIGGADGLSIGALVTTDKSITIVDNNTAPVVVVNLEGTSLTSATFTNSVNTTAAVFEINGGSTITETALDTLNLNGNVTIAIVGDTVDTGITVAGGTDNAVVSVSFSEATASGATDSITLGNGAGDSVTLGAGLAGSTQTIVLGSGAGDSIVTTTAGAVNATVGSATTGTDTITADSASSLHATAGNGTNVISDTAAGAAIAITVGTGANIISVGDNTTGTINLGAHAATVADAITIGVSGTSLTAIEKIGGLNNSGLDTLTFTGDPSTLTFTQVTSAAVDGFHGNTTQLSDWIAAATGESGSGITGTAHSVMWFTFQNNTYLVETVGADSGTLATGDTVVELTGTAYTFAHATTAGGIVHLMS